MRWIKPLLLALSLLPGTVLAAEVQYGIHRIFPATFNHRWTLGHWTIWAMPGNTCMAINQYDTARVQFWGFRQTGPQLDLIFYTEGAVQPQTLQMSFNDAGKFDYAATVVRLAEYDAYLVPLRFSSTAVFPNTIDFQADAGGNRIWWEREFNMSKVDDAMAKCVEWQYDH